MTPEKESDQTDLVTRTYQRVRDLIISGRLAPGTRVIESDLADRLRISRTPVRSALHRLQQEGWVSGSGKGKQLRLTVSPLTQDDARELFHIIGALEGLAARWAASLPLPDRAALVGELRALNDELDQEAKSANPDPQRVFELHSAFHLRLVHAVRAPRLRVLHAAIKPQAYRYRRVYSTALVPAAPGAAVEHEMLLRGIAAGVPVEAEHATRTNWSNAADRMCQIIETWGEKGSW